MKTYWLITAILMLLAAAFMDYSTDLPWWQILPGYVGLFCLFMWRLEDLIERIRNAGWAKYGSIY
jgi:hypothetical protein